VAAGVEVRGVAKAYGSTRALAGIDLDIRPGEILGIAGPNGAGKSTLVRMLDGQEDVDAGSLSWDGEPWDAVRGPRRVTVVHQEPQLFPTITVGENLVIGRESSGTAKPSPGPAELEVHEQLGIRAHAGTTLANCSLAVRQFTALARALVANAELFLFDEPNSALTESESERLFTFMRELADEGKLVVLVTHRLAELEAHADRVAIILDGRCSAVLTGDDVRQTRIARELVAGIDAVAGTELHDEQMGEAHRGVTLRAAGWEHGGGAFADIDLELAPGEIVALVGVEGSGGRELLASLNGLEPASGELTDGDGGPAPRCAFVAADRRSSLFPNLSVASNLVSRLGRPRIAGSLGLLRPAAANRLADDMRRTFNVRAGSVAQPLTTLSGGNQQKVAIAAAIALEPVVLLLEEPTRGVDVGSKAEIYRLLKEFVRDGRSLMMFCTEVVEAFEAADRVLILDHGRIVGALPVARFDGLASLAAEIAETRERARAVV
jgi:ABC-type sugar transport system ATPase subunit